MFFTSKTLCAWEVTKVESETELSFTDLLSLQLQVFTEHSNSSNFNAKETSDVPTLGEIQKWRDQESKIWWTGL